MTDTTVETKVIEHGEASLLPDTSWFFRRILLFVVVFACLWFAWSVLDRVSDVLTLRMIARYSLGLVGLCVFIYVAGASATDVVRLVTALKSTRKETVMSAPPPATATLEGVVSEDDGTLPEDQRVRP